jgi:hypothetical protein|nr:hypothetical protein [Rhodoferax sp.]
MGEWSDYFEDFPEENPANQWCDTEGDLLRARVAREAMYSPEVLAEIADRKKRREAEEVLLIGMRLRDREQAQAEMHRSIGGLMEAYAWFDVNLGLKIKSYSTDPSKVAALVKPSTPMKLRLDYLRQLVELSQVKPTVQSKSIWKAWIAQAEAIRLLRNDYAHGRWINSSLVTTEFHFAPLGWSDEYESTQTLIAVSPAQIDSLSNELWNLTRSMNEVLEPYFLHP